jgi:hypothetical protein
MVARLPGRYSTSKAVFAWLTIKGGEVGRRIRR